MMMCSICWNEAIKEAQKKRERDSRFYCVICESQYQGIGNPLHLDNPKVKIDPRQIVELCNECFWQAQRANLRCPLLSEGDSCWDDIHRKFDCFCSIPKEKQDNPFLNPWTERDE